MGLSIRDFLFRLTFGLVAVTSIALSVGCGIAPEGDDSESAQRRRQNDKLERSYTSIQGLYRGALRIKAPVAQDPDDAGADQYRELDGTLLLYVTTAQEGYDRAGAPIFHPRLFAQLKFDGVGELDDTTFIVDYNEVSGDVDFKQPQATGGGGGSASSPIPVGSVSSCPVGPRDSQLTMRGRIIGGLFNEGRVTGTNGALGSITMKLESAGAFQPIRDQRERLEKAYAKVTGTWQGSSGVSTEDRMVQVNSSVYVTTDEITVAEGVTCPQLRARFRLEDVIGRLDDTFMNVSYREGTGEIFFTATAPPANRRVCSMGPQDLKTAIVGNVKSDQLMGILKGSTGDQGAVKMKRTGSNAIAPDDQRIRQTKIYSRLAGIYAGWVTSDKQDFPVAISLRVSDVTIDGFLSCKGLVADYTRPDLTSGAGTIQTKVDYAQLENRVTIYHEPKSTIGIPGHDYLSITGMLTLEGGRATMQGDLGVWNGAGPFKAVRCAKGQRVDPKGKCVASRTSGRR